MPTSRLLNAAIGIGFALAVCSCKKQESPKPAVTPGAVQADANNGTGAAKMPPATTSTTDAMDASGKVPDKVLADAAALAPKENFSLEQVPLTTAPLPPFPFISYPDKLPQNQRPSHEETFDELYVIAGSSLRRLEGHYSDRWFVNSAGDLSDLGSRRNYHAALAAIGAVKVNRVTPDDPALLASAGVDKAQLQAKLGMKLSTACSKEYGTYLIRTTGGNIWFVLTVCEGMTQLLTLQEQPLRQSVTPLAGPNSTSAVNAVKPETN